MTSARKTCKTRHVFQTPNWDNSNLADNHLRSRATHSHYALSTLRNTLVNLTVNVISILYTINFKQHPCESDRERPQYKIAPCGMIKVFELNWVQMLFEEERFQIGFEGGKTYNWGIA